MYYVYLLGSQPHGTLYVGKTTDLLKRIWEHKKKAVPGSPRDTVSIGWCGSKRAWKIELIERDNPHWLDLYSSFSP